VEIFTGLIRFQIINLLSFCGDSTGHGVPGALMSMIGTTLIKDICNRPDVVNPSNILDKLDDEIRKTLNQNLESAGKMNDGMGSYSL